MSDIQKRIDMIIGDMTKLYTMFTIPTVTIETDGIDNASFPKISYQWISPKAEETFKQLGERLVELKRMESNNAKSNKTHT